MAATVLLRITDSIRHFRQTIHPNGGEAAAYAGEADMTDPPISPIFAKSWDGFPPTLIASGTRDLLLSDSARLSTAMRRGGGDVRLHVWEGMWHVFECYPEIPESACSLREIASFLSDHIDADLRRR